MAGPLGLHTKTIIMLLESNRRDLGGISALPVGTYAGPVGTYALRDGKFALLFGTKDTRINERSFILSRDLRNTIFNQIKANNSLLKAYVIADNSIAGRVK